MQIIFLYENESLKLFNNYKLFDNIKIGHDKLIEKVGEHLETKNIQNLLFYIYENEERNAFYKVKICKEETKYTHNFDDFRSVSSKNNISQVLSDALLTIYNYKEVLINDILVRDEYGNKIKPEIKLYYLQSLGAPQIDGLKFIRKHEYTYKKNNLDDTAIYCYTESEVLLDLLARQDLYFELNESIYALFLFDTVIYLKEVSSKYKYESKFTVIDYANNMLVKASIVSLFTKYPYISDIAHCKNGFYNEVFREKINDRFNSFVRRLENEQIKIKNDDLLSILNALPIFTDHRKRYYEKLVAAYSKLEKAQGGKITSDNSYLTITEQKIIDKTPFGSLKHHFYSERH